MPRAARELLKNGIYHVLNRGNNKQIVFHKEVDFHVFMSLLIKSKNKFPVLIFGYCLMPNHYHIIMQASEPVNVRRYVHWAMTCFAEYSHLEYKTTGHIWQGRYKSILVDNDQYMLTLLRYIEGNPIWMDLVSSAGDWPWSSIKNHCQNMYNGFVDPPPFGIPRDWLRLVNTPLTGKELECLRKNRAKRNKGGQSPPEGTVPLIC